MSKPKAPPKQAQNEARAVLRTLRISPQKLNLVAQSIRGLKVETALAELQFSRKRIAKDVWKCLWSAKANAEENHNLDIDNLVVAQAHVGKNIIMKRMNTRARGRGARIHKLFSQITIVVREVEGEAKAKKKAPAKKVAAKKAAPKKQAKQPEAQEAA